MQERLAKRIRTSVSNLESVNLADKVASMARGAERPKEGTT